MDSKNLILSLHTRHSLEFELHHAVPPPEVPTDKTHKTDALDTAALRELLEQVGQVDDLPLPDVAAVEVVATKVYSDAGSTAD
jgi:hypothetical protein